MSTMPIHARLYEVMRERILTGEWSQGERLPSERMLVEEFGVSRGPVRQALAALRTEGFIAGGRGSAPRVQRFVPSQPFDTFISFTDWAKTLGKVSQQKVIEVSRRLATESMADGLGIQVAEQVLEVVRLRSIEGSPVMLDKAVYPFQIGEPLLTADLEKESIYQVLRQHGTTPTRAKNVIDAAGADDLDQEWLDVPLGSPILRVRRTTFDALGNIIELTDNRYLPSMANLTIDNVVPGHSLPAKTVQE